MKIRKGQIYIADLNPTVGSEQGGIRPVLILQNNFGNKNSPTVLVACITTKINDKSKVSTHSYAPKGSGLKEKSIVMFEQIRTIDNSRIHKYIGKVPRDYMSEIDRKLRISFGIRSKKDKKNENKSRKLQ